MCPKPYSNLALKPFSSDGPSSNFGQASMFPETHLPDRVSRFLTRRRVRTFPELFRQPCSGCGAPCQSGSQSSMLFEMFPQAATCQIQFFMSICVSHLDGFKNILALCRSHVPAMALRVNLGLMPRCFPSCFHSHVPAAVLHVSLCPIPRWHQGCGRRQVPHVNLRLALMAPLYKTNHSPMQFVCLSFSYFVVGIVWCSRRAEGEI